MVGKESKLGRSNVYPNVSTINYILDLSLSKAQSHCAIVSLPEEREVIVASLKGLYDD